MNEVVVVKSVIAVAIALVSGTHRDHPVVLKICRTIPARSQLRADGSACDLEESHS